MDPASILRFLADLAAGSTPDGDLPFLPAGGAPEMLDLTRTQEPSEWLGTSIVLPLTLPGQIPSGEATAAATVPRTATIRHLAALDALQPTERLLRLGWVVVAGTFPVDDRSVTCCFPLVSQPVRLVSSLLRQMTIVPAGAPELTPLVTDAEQAARLEAAVQYGGGALTPGYGADGPSAQLIARLPHLQAWIRSVVKACGLPPLTAIVPPSTDPRRRRHDQGLAAVVGATVYLARDVFRPSIESALRSWATRPGIEATSFTRLLERTSAPTAAPADPVCTPLLLSAAQAEAVQRARHEPITVISGPPGNGKSHTVAAIASDAVAQGGSVLVAARSRHAADVIAALLDRQTGPDPVRFGGTQNDDIVRQSTTAGATPSDVSAAHHALQDARARQRLAESAVEHMLDLEQRADRAESWDGLVGELSALVPGAFDPASDLDAVAVRLESCAPPADARWWRRWRARRRERHLRSTLRTAPTTTLADVRTAVRCAADRRAAAELAARGGTALGALWDQLLAADQGVRQAAGRVAEVEGSREDRRRQGRGAANDLATALRAGRRQRRRLLHQLDGFRIVRALPLWVGTLGDVDDLLPDTPGLFDLVILDEASQIDQLSAAGALLRARRAVVVGDPHQLRHVSFVSDALLATTLAAHGLTPLAALLDVRRASVLDVAAGSAPVTWLDEHYRSVPHLIDFSARRFYDGRLFVATRHPANESADAIEVVRITPVDGAGGTTGEVDAALALVARLAAEGRTDIAVVSPFRDVADAAQAALLAIYELDDVERLGLRVGTVHAFQGAEADHVVLVLGLSADDAAGRRRFVEDPHLFNVMVTRAKRSLVVVTSLPPQDVTASSGLVEQYLAHADRPPSPPRADGGPIHEWASALARELRAGGVTTRCAYPVGRWTVDVCAGDGAGAVAVEAVVHPRGVPAHIARHRTLTAAGWRHADGYPTRWDHDAARAAIELSTAIRPTGRATAAVRRVTGDPST